MTTVEADQDVIEAELEQGENLLDALGKLPVVETINSNHDGNYPGACELEMHVADGPLRKTPNWDPIEQLDKQDTQDRVKFVQDSVTWALRVTLTSEEPGTTFFRIRVVAIRET